MAIFKIVPLLSALSMLSCDQSKDSGHQEQLVFSADSTQQFQSSKCLGIVGGIESSEFPAVVQLVRLSGQVVSAYCSGTFISDNIAVTAAHCIDESYNGGLSARIFNCAGSLVREVRAFRVVHHGLVGKAAVGIQGEEVNGVRRNISVQPDVVEQDLAFVVFPEKTAPASIELSKTPPTASRVALVGYGLETAIDAERNPDPYKKRVGYNELSGKSFEYRSSEGGLVIFSPESARASGKAGDYAFLSSGDSGCALIQGNYLIGVGSNAQIWQEGDKRVDTSTFVDVVSAKTSELKLKAATAGLDIDAKVPAFDAAMLRYYDGLAEAFLSKIIETQAAVASKSSQSEPFPRTIEITCPRGGRVTGQIEQYVSEGADSSFNATLNLDRCRDNTAEADLLLDGSFKYARAKGQGSFSGEFTIEGNSTNPIANRYTRPLRCTGATLVTYSNGVKGLATALCN